MFLEVQGIRKSFGTGDSKVDVLKGLDLQIERGEFCVLLGPSGSGKSTLLNIIGGIDAADAGSITIDGERLEDKKDLPDLAKAAMADVCTGGNPRPCTEELVLGVYEKAF